MANEDRPVVFQSYEADISLLQLWSEKLWLLNHPFTEVCSVYNDDLYSYIRADLITLSNVIIFFPACSFVWDCMGGFSLSQVVLVFFLVL